MNHSFNGQRPRILTISLRQVEFHVSRCCIYEFEDTLCAVDNVELHTPSFTASLATRVRNRLARSVFEATGSGQFLNPMFNQFYVDKEYDVFFVYCQNPLDLLHLSSIKNWREKCHKAVVWLEEIWLKDIEKCQVQLGILKNFDYIFMSYSSSLDAVANIVQRPFPHLPFGIDSVKFCPYPLQPHRSIDVYSMGRRSSITHKALLEHAKKGDFFYIYDTAINIYVAHKHHRDLSSNLVKRSRYFIANKPKFENIDTTGAQEELGARFFEGAAGGAVMLGSPPACAAYYAEFDWPDAVIELSYKATDVADILADLDAQPERLERIRIDNVVNSLLRHDWVYRWRKILETVGLEPTPELVSREAFLQHLATMVHTTVT